VKRALTYCYFSGKNSATFFQGSDSTNCFEMHLVDCQLAHIKIGEDLAGQIAYG
jgi:hypothetical protein